jgi:hypothetical protein
MLYDCLLLYCLHGKCIYSNHTNDNLPFLFFLFGFSFVYPLPQFYQLIISFLLQALLFRFQLPLNLRIQSLEVAQARFLSFLSLKCINLFLICLIYQTDSYHLMCYQ